MSNPSTENATPEPMWGKSLEADFVKGTWTFEMVGEDWEVSVGMYALIYNDDYQLLVKKADEYEYAESLLLKVREVSALLPDTLREKIASFFDPNPL